MRSKATSAPCLHSATHSSCLCSSRARQAAVKRGSSSTWRRAWGEIHCADIEDGPWPFAGRQFGAVIVTNYLWRPLLPLLVDSVAPGGVLIYETFASGNETVGRPARADFLLQPGELLAACATLRTVAYEDGFVDAPARFVQRIAAVRETAHPRQPVRYRLDLPV